MRAVVCERLGDPCNADSGALRFVTNCPRPDATTPLPPGHVRVKILSASLNYADLLQVQGLYQDRAKPPFVVGSDFAGLIISASDKGVPPELRAPGTRVCGVGANKAFAEEAVVPAAALWRLPEGLEDMHAAAGIPVAFGTADLALRHRARLQRGQTLLVLGASGGVGAAAVQIGRLLGARVVAVARGADKARFLREELGAHAVVDTAALEGAAAGGGSGGGETDGKALAAAFKAALQEAVVTAPDTSAAKAPRCRPLTADVVFDNVGGAQFSAALRCASWGAQLLAVGFASGTIPSVPANLLLVKNATLHGVFWGAHLSNPQAGPSAAAALRSSVEQVLEWCAAGKLRVPVSARLPLERAGEAAALMARRRVMGKVLLVVDGGDGGGAAADTAQGEAGGGAALGGGPPPYPRSRL